MNVIGVIIGILVGSIVSGFIIWVVGKLGWGIEVDGFGPAFLTAIFISVLNGLANWFYDVINFTPEGGWVGAVTHLVLAAGFLVAAGSLIKGLRVKGFTGALIAAVVIAAVGWLIGGGVSLLV